MKKRIMKKYKFLKYLFLALILPSCVFGQTKEHINRELQKVHTYISEKNYAQGMSTLNELQLSNPNDNDVYRSYGELLLELGQYDLAITNIQKAILLSRANPSNHLIAGNIYRARNDYEEAQQAYDTAVRLAPGLGEIYTEFALLNLQHNFLQEAQRLAALAYHYNKDFWQNIILRATIEQKNNQRTKAQQIYLEGIQNFPYNEQLLDAFAEFYISNNEYDKAVVILEEANSRFGESFARNQLLGDSAFIENHQDQAMFYYDKIDKTLTSLNLPLSPLIRWRLYTLHLKTDPEKSYEFLQSAVELDPMNQLYISAFYQHLLSVDKPTLKTSLAQHLEKLANQERKSGFNIYLLTLLQKIVSLTPSNNNARRYLLDYAKIQQNEAQVQRFLEETLSYDKDNKELQTKLDLRSHLARTKRLDRSIRPEYQYTNKIFVDDNICHFASSVQKELQNLETYFPKFHNQIELRQTFAQESRTLFRTNTNYNIVSHLYIQDSTIIVDMYDKNGLPLTSFKHGFQARNFSQILNSLVQSLDDLLPPIGYIDSRQLDSQFKITLGTKDNISTNMQVAILDADFNPLTTAEVVSTTPYDSIIKQLSIPLRSIDIESAYIVPLEYVPSLNDNIQNTNVIKDINQIKQTRYPKQINFLN